MTSSLNARLMRLAKFAGIPLLAVLIGGAVAVASSPASVTRSNRVLGTPLPVTPSPSASASPSPPTVTEPGVLGTGGHLIAAGSAAFAATGFNIAAASADSGKTWTTMRPPAKASGVAIDPNDPLHGITGGTSIQVTLDGGVTWKPVQTAAPGVGPYQPFQISPFQGSIWFLIHGGKLLRTRDGGLTWLELVGLPSLAAPVMVAGPVYGQFYLASGSSVFELIDNGQQIVAQPSLPAGVLVAELAAVGGTESTLYARGSDNGLYLLKGGIWSASTGTRGGPIAAGSNGILVVGNGGAKLGSPGAVAYSTDGGSTWREASGLPYDQSVEALAGQPTSTTLVAYCYGGDIYMSADGGATWTLLTRALRASTG